ncbi:MAG: MbtH family protein [Anaerolineales bacterium]|nr:MbtH family protein [Anaerolineales bacterium]
MPHSIQAGRIIQHSQADTRSNLMNRDEQEDTTIYKVVVNHEEQYSIWPADRELPLGWREAGKSGLKAECLAYIEEVWTDMRPLSLRKKMEEMEKNQGEEEG